MNNSTPINQLPSQQSQALPAEILNEDDNVIQDMLSNFTTPDIPHEDIYKLATQQSMPAPAATAATATPADAPPSKLVDWMNLFSNEFKLAGYVFMAVVIVHFIPFHKYLGKYIALEKIPYNEILLRAIAAALIVIIAQKIAT